MADRLSEMADKDDRIIAITAAMPLGTGLDHFGEKYPERLIDVGIAEEHAASMAAGLASAGMRPYYAVYATFFQRCFDQMIHDVCMQHLPVVFLLDRSGIGSEDGQTHHGVFDFASLLPVPGITVLSPCDANELCSMLSWTLLQDKPVAIRYCKDGTPLQNNGKIRGSFVPGRWEVLRSGKDLILLATGSMVRISLQVAEQLENQGFSTEVVNCSSVKPVDEEYLKNIRPGIHVYTLEEHMITGGFGAFVSEKCREFEVCPPEICFGIPELFIQHGRHDLLMKDAGLSAEQICERILQSIRKERSN